MSIQPTVAPTVFEGIDLEGEVPCNYGAHARYSPADLPASYMVAAACLGCPSRYRYPICADCWTAIRPTISHSECGATRMPRHDVLRIVEVLR